METFQVGKFDLPGRKPVSKVSNQTKAGVVWCVSEIAACGYSPRAIIFRTVSTVIACTMLARKGLVFILTGSPTQEAWSTLSAHLRDDTCRHIKVSSVNQSVDSTVAFCDLQPVRLRNPSE